MIRWPEGIIKYTLPGLLLLLISFSNAPAGRYFPATNSMPEGLVLPYSQVPTSGLIASYPFNGNAEDESGNANHGSVTGAILEQDRFCQPDKAYYFNGSSYISTTTQYPAPGPNHLTFSAWFKTTTTTGGKLIGYGNAQTGASSQFDRHIYMNDQGQLIFGVYLGNFGKVHFFGIVKTTASYNNGEWHHVVATLSGNGIKLYVNGALQEHNASFTVGEDFSGYWKIGYDDLKYWPEQPTSNFFTGSLDDIHIYDREITPSEVDQLYMASGNVSVSEQRLCAGQTLNLSATTLAGATYSWSGPDGFTSSEQNPVIPSVSAAKAGTYSVTITGSGGCSFQESTQLTVDPATAGGTLAGDAIVCSGANSGTISLSAHTGDVVRWESATVSDFSTFTSIASTALELSYLNLNQSTYYRAVVKSGVCEEAFSTTAFVEVSQVQGGALSGGTEVCASGNTGALRLSDYQGAIERWEASADGFVSDVQAIALTEAELIYNNLRTTTSYRAVVGNGGICPAEYSSTATIEVSAEAVGGAITGPSLLCAGSNSATFILADYQGEIVRWESSADGFVNDIQYIANTAETYTIQDLSISTSFRALLRSGPCPDVYSEAKLVEVEEPPQGGSLSGGGLSLCAGSNSGSIELSGHTGSVFRWESSTDGFASDIQPIAHTGSSLYYENLTQTTSFRAVVGNESCGEKYSTLATLELSQPSQGGTLEGSAIVCKGSNSGQLSLLEEVGEVLRWESSTDGFATSPLQIQSESKFISYHDLSETTYYRAVVKNGACDEAFSTIAVVEVSEVVAGAVSGGKTVCEGTHQGVLQLSGYQGEIVRWESSPDGFQTIEHIENTTDELYYENLAETTSFRAVVGNGGLCAEVYAEPASIQLDTAPVGGSIAGGTRVCAENNSGTLVLENYLGTILRWESSTDGFISDIKAIELGEPSLTFENLKEETFFRAVLGSSFCGETFSEQARIEVDQAALGGTVEGGGRLKAGANSGTLSLQGYFGTIIRWEVSADNFASDIREVEQIASTYSYQNLEKDSWFRAVVQNGSCGEVYASPAELLINQAPLAGEDAFSIPYGQPFSSERSLLENDSDPEGDPLLVQPLQEFITAAGNRVEMDEHGYFHFQTVTDFSGSDYFTYQLCDEVGEASTCSEGLVLLEITRAPEREVVVYQGFSPNHDGKNDRWIIEHIEQFPDNQVRIFDRYGILVYETKGYDNQGRVFEGFSNRGFATAGDPLPEGTYFYQIYLDAEEPLLKGYVVLNR